MKRFEMYAIRDSKGKYISCDECGELHADDEPYSLWPIAEHALGFIEGYQDGEDYGDEIDVSSLVVIPIEVKELS